MSFDNDPNLGEMWSDSDNLTDGQRALRDRFVIEYLKDLDYFKAALRCGFNSAFAIDWGKRLLSESYVQRELDKLTAPVTDSGKQAEIDKLRNMQHLRHLAAHATQENVRVAAIKELNAMYGFNKPEPAEDSAERIADMLATFAKGAPV